MTDGDETSKSCRPCYFGSLPACAGRTAPADLVIRNARVITVDPRDRVAEAVAVRGDRIIAVGTNAEIDGVRPVDEDDRRRGQEPAAGPVRQPRPPAGRVVERERPPDPGVPVAGRRDGLHQGTRAGSQPKGTWIVVRYAFPTRLEEGRFPTRAELDAVAPDHPVLHQAGPAGVVNSKALEFSGRHPRHPRPARRAGSSRTRRRASRRA